MGANKRNELEKTKEERHRKNLLSCQRCGCKVPLGESSWEEDGEGFVCQDCRAENESCGCSD